MKRHSGKRMSLIKSIVMVYLICSLPLSVFSADHAVSEPVDSENSVEMHGDTEGSTETAHGEDHSEHHGLPPNAVQVFEFSPVPGIGPLIITNSMIVTWIVAFFLIIFAQIATRKIEKVPSGIQNFWEWLVEGLYDFLEAIIGNELMKKTFWFFATLFIFILSCNWFGLIPGVGTIGWGIASPSGGFTVTEPFFRGANADLNMTLGMSLIFFACWTVWALQSNGPKGFFLHIFGPKGDTKGALKILMIGVFAIVGLLEVISILFRPVSLSFRLYGNVYAGENMLESMAVISSSPIWSVLIHIPFYFLEVLVGLVQAMVFMLLTAVFTLLICQHEEGHEAQH